MVSDLGADRRVEEKGYRLVELVEGLPEPWVVGTREERHEVQLAFHRALCGTYLGKTSVTRGTYSKGVITNDAYSSDNSIKSAQFGVFAYQPTAGSNFTTWSSWNPSTPTQANVVPNFMYNEHLQWDDTNNYWYYTPVKYWPNGIDAANGTNGPSSTATETTPQSLSFFAYAPYITTPNTDYSESGDGAIPTGLTDGNIKKNSGTKGIIAMTTNTSATDMWVKYLMPEATSTEAIDLLWGMRGQNTYTQTATTNTVSPLTDYTYNTDLTKQIVQEKVVFLFKHALAKVGGATAHETTGTDPEQCGLKVVLDVDANSSEPLTGSDDQPTYLGSNFDNTKTRVTIKSVKIRDQYTYTVTEDGDKHDDESTTTRTDAASDLATTGWFDIMNGTWSTISTNAKIESSKENDKPGVKYDQTIDTNLNSAIKDVTVSGGESTYIDGDTWKSSMPEGVVPTKLQNVYANVNAPALLVIPGSADGVKNTLYVTVNYVVRTVDSKLNAGYTEVEQTITNKVQLTGSTMKANKYYTLVMHLGLTSVKFEAKVSDWTMGGSEYSENGSTTNGSEVGTDIIWLPSNVVSTSTATTVAAGNSVSVSAAADATSYTINLTGVKDSTTPTAIVTGSGASVGTFSVATSGKSAATVTLPGSTGTYEVTITSKNDSDENVETKVTIKQ